MEEIFILIHSFQRSQSIEFGTLESGNTTMQYTVVVEYMEKDSVHVMTNGGGGRAFRLLGIMLL
jgi:hypothetical protein